MRIAQLIPGLGPVRRWGFDLNRYKHALHHNMVQDSTTSPRPGASSISTIPFTSPDLLAPRIHETYSRPTVLVQDYCAGVPLRTAAGWAHQDRLTLEPSS